MINQRKDKKILIVGFGSIGRRHYDNLKNLGYENVFVYDKDKNKVANLADSAVQKFTGGDFSQYSVVFICNPNSEHIKTAVMAAKAGCHLFIEKPLSHSMSGLNSLEKIIKKKKLITMVGCNMRFHPCLEFIKKSLDGGKLGKTYTIIADFGYFLPYWRPGTDYSKNYAAKKSEGGGIVLDDIHEFDLVFWLNNFSPVVKNSILRNKASNLRIETEDQAAGVFIFKNKTLGVVVADYLSQSYRRKITIVGEKGNLSWDFNENIVWFYEKDGRKEVYRISDFDFNRTYISEIKYFLDKVSRKEETFNSVEKAKLVLKEIIR